MNMKKSDIYLDNHRGHQTRSADLSSDRGQRVTFFTELRSRDRSQVV